MKKVKGKIIDGLGRATRLGFPTFNIVLPNEVEGGVYAGKVHFAKQNFSAVLFADTRRKVLEAHLFGFGTGEKEGEIEMTIVEKIRDSKLFPHDGQLIEQIKKDVAKVRELFK